MGYFFSRLSYSLNNKHMYALEWGASVILPQYIGCD